MEGGCRLIEINEDKCTDSSCGTYNLCISDFFLMSVSLGVEHACRGEHNFTIIVLTGGAVPHLCSEISTFNSILHLHVHMKRLLAELPTEGEAKRLA